MDAATFATYLQNVSPYGAGGWWRASCPGPKHKRGNLEKPALAFRDDEDGKLVLKCHAGNCTRAEIFAVLNIKETKDVKVREVEKDESKQRKGDSGILGRIVAQYIYKNAAGATICRRTRHEPKDFRWWTPDGESWKLGLDGVTPPLYRLNEIRKKQDVVIVEGEKDADRAWNSLKFPATTSGGTGSWEPEHSEQLKDAGCARAWVIPDDDDVGLEHAQTVVMSCVSIGIDARIVKIVDPEEKKQLAKDGKPLKDLSDWLDAGHTKEELLTLFVEAPRELPHIDAGEQNLRVISEQAWDAVVRANGDDPNVFRFGNRLATLGLQEGASPQIETLDEKDFRYLLARMANWYKVTKKKIEAAKPPQHVIDDMFSRVNLLSRDVPVPQILRIIETPVFARGGRFDQTRGYQPVGRVYLESPDGFDIPDVPTKPKDKDVAQAKDILFARKDSLLGEFPFKEQASRANAVACMLEPFVRDVFRVPSPFYMIKKPVTGTGATYLAQALMIPFLGKVVGVMSECKDEDEWRKRLTAKLRLLEPVIVIDNINRKLGNGHLCGAVTTGVWEDRVLGESRILKIPVSTTWIGTANNPTMTSEMLSRVVWIRLEPRMDEMMLRDRRWTHPDLHGWALDERARLVWACAVLIRRWFAESSPPREGGTRFARWGEVMGGILQSAGIEGFLENRDEERDVVEDDHSAMRAFVTQVWASKHGEREVTAKDLVEDVIKNGYDAGIGIEGEDVVAKSISLAKKLNREYRDNHFGGWAVRLGKKRHNLQHYRLEKSVVAPKDLEVAR